MNLGTRFLFFPIARAASTSINQSLGLNPKINTHKQVSCIEPRMYNGHYTSSFVRNPWDRLLSSYIWLRQIRYKDCELPNSFEEFVKKLDTERAELFPSLECKIDANPMMQILHLRPMSFYLDKPIDFIGKYEKLNKDFFILCDKIGIARAIPNKLRVTEHKTYKSHYNKKTKDIVSRLYKVDIEKFNYSFEE
jgi:chondroitin 4-sulfotransferase 11